MILRNAFASFEDTEYKTTLLNKMLNEKSSFIFPQINNKNRPLCSLAGGQHKQTNFISTRPFPLLGTTKRSPVSPDILSAFEGLFKRASRLKHELLQKALVTPQF